MKTKKLQKLFSKRYSDGFLQKRKNKIEVFFGTGKIYTYNGSNYSIAEKLELIPPLYNMEEDTRHAIEKLENGEKVKIKSVLIDTIREKWNRNHNTIIESGEIKNYTDKYGRSFSTVVIDTIDPKNNQWR